MNIVTRIAPSPTGEMHIGTVRTALFNYLFAKHHGGTYLVRIEDTDKERNRSEWIDAIWRDFSWVGIEPDQKFIQSEHVSRHRELLLQLIDSDKAYISKEPAKDDPSRMVEVVRLRNPGSSITFDDLVRGSVTFDTTELGDFVIARSVNDPLYHFAVVVDDHDEGVTHVLRAEEHLSNTPRQILIQEALGFSRPIYGHFPLILAPDRSKLSKRKHSASVEHYRAEGIRPEALINYLALLGWNPGTEQELFTLEELVQQFDILKVHKSGAVFDPEKLRWYNREYLNRLDTAAYASEALPILKEELDARQIPWSDERARRILPIIRERVSTWQDLRVSAREGEYDFFFVDPMPGKSDLHGKDATAGTASEHLARVHELLAALDDVSFQDPERLKSTVWEYATEMGRGAVLWPMRFALSGRKRSPDPFTIASILGRTITLERLKKAQNVLI